MDFSTKKIILGKLEGFLTENKQELFERVLAKRTKHITIAIEDVYHQHNAGALVRTADCFGIQDVHVMENSYNNRVTNSISRGADKWVDMHVYTREENNTLNCINEIKKQGYQIVATSPHADDFDLADFDITKKSALFFGAEKVGISDIVRENADTFVKIPIVGFTESFNVSVAAAIMLYDITNRMYNSNISWQLTEEEKVDIKLQWTLQTIPRGQEVMDNFLAQL